MRSVAVLAAIALIPIVVVTGLTGVRPANADPSSDYASVVLGPGLGGGSYPNAYWRLGESSGSTAVDSSTNSHDGTYHNVTLGRPSAIRGGSNTAVGFNGTTSYIDAGTGPALAPATAFDGSNFMFETWERTTGSVSTEQYLLSQRDATSGGADGGVILSISNHKARFSLFDSAFTPTGFNIEGQGPNVDDGKWHYIAGTVGNYAATLVVDGVPVGVDNSNFLSNPPVLPKAHGVYVGVDGRNSNAYFQGDLDEAAILPYQVAVFEDTGFFDRMAAAGRPLGGPMGVSQFGSRSIQNNYCQVCKGDPVNTATGNFSESVTDLATPGRGLALDVTRSYNAQLAVNDAAFGHGWSFPYGMGFSQTSTTAQVTEEGGTTVTFYRNGSSYTPTAPRFAAALTDNLNGTVTFTRLGREFYTFDTATGHLLSEQDVNGQNASPTYATTFTYSAGLLATVTDPAGRTYTFGWTGTHVTSLTDSSSPARKITYVYDGSGNLTDVYGVNTTRSPTLLDNDHTVYTYDSSHRMLTMRSPKYFGSTITPTPVTTNVYDASDRVTSQTDPLGRQTTFNYTTVPGSTITTDPAGHATLDTYDDGLRRSTTVGYGTASAATTQYGYDPTTLGVTKTTDANSHLWTATYDSAGNKLTATDPLTRTTTYSYNGYNEVASITEAKTFGGVNASTTFNYDEAGHSSGGAGNLTSKSSPLLNTSGATIGTQTIVYNHSSSAHPGDVTSSTDPDGNTTTFAYDSFGDLTSQSAPATPENSAGNQTQYGYDTTKGWLTSTVSPRGVLASVTTSCTPPALGCTTYAHDAWGHVTTTTDPLGHTTVAHYDANGNQDSVTDALTHATSTAFDAANEPTVVTRADTTTLSNDYYNDGRLHHQYDGANNATTYAYDSLGRVSTVTDPDSHTTTYTYDPIGNQTGKADTGGSCAGTITTSSKCTTSVYDAANELTSTSYSDGVTPNVTSITYDADGQRAGMTDGTGTSSWAYDSLHRLTSTTNGAGKTIGYGYNLRSETTSIVYPSSTGTVTRTYDAIGRVATVTDWLTHQTSFTYNADSFQTSQINPNTTTDTNTPNNADQLTGISDAPTSTPGSPFASFAYGRDNAGQVSSVTSTGVPTDNNSYTYNALNQLAKVNTPAYGHDSADNLTVLTSGATQKFDPANELCWTSPSGGSGTCGAPPSDATTYTHDTRGNRTSKLPQATAQSTYTYDQANRLASANVPYESGALGQFRSLTPTRVLDTRTGTGLPIGTCYQPNTTSISCGSKLTANTPRYFQIAGFAGSGVPATGVDAVSIVVTAMTPSTAGTANVFASNASAPSTQILTFPAGPSASNGLVSKLGPDGRLAIQSSVATNVAVDIAGYYTTSTGTTGGTYVPVTPTVLTTGTLAVSAKATIQVTGNAGIPAVTTPGGVSAVVAQLNVTGPTADGFAEVWDAGTTRNTSVRNLSFANGDNQTGMVMSKLSSTGQMSLYAGTSGFTYTLTVLGYYTTTPVAAGTLNIGQTPTRLLKTGTTPIGSCTPSCATLAGNTQLSVQATGAAGIPATGVKAVSAVVTSVNLTGSTAGNIAVGNTAGTPNPTAQFAAGETTSNSAIVRVDADGKIVVKNNTTANRDIIIDVVGWQEQATKTWSYTYNGDGLRQSKTVDATTIAHTWDTSGSLPLVVQDGTTNYIYTPNGTLLEQISGSTPTYYHHDQQGSTRALTNSSGTVIATYTYDSYGKPNGATGSITQPFGYTGQYTDNETGFQYLRARYYDPSTGQFLTRDPLVASTRSAYGYVAGNPINGLDPTGLWGWNPIDDAEQAWNDTGGKVVHAIRQGGESLGRGIQHAGEYAWKHRDVVASVAAAGTCLVPGIGLVGCAFAATLALGVRSEQRFEENGFSGSLGANLTDAGLTYVTLGLAGSFEALAAPWPGIARGIGALDESQLLGYLGRFFPAGYDFTSIWKDIQASRC